MQYRKFGKLDWKSSALGFGAMRLPQLGQEMSSPINEPEAIKMIRYAIDHGVNYVDTAFPYGAGDSERLVGKALQDGYRQKVRLATKLSPAALKSPDEFPRFLDSQFKRLQTDKIDFYLLHGLNANNWKLLKEWKAIQFVEKKIVEGKIGYLGFSFHNPYEIFKEIIDYYENWTFCQIQYNYMDENHQAGRKGVEYAASKNMALVVMEPLRGGQLAKDPPPVVASVWAADPERNRVEMAFDWVWDQPEISVVLSGMSTIEQVKQNVAFAERSSPHMLKDKDRAFFNQVIDAYNTLSPVPCTGCRYCQPCPNGVNIPKIFELYNDKVQNDNPQPNLWYATDLGMPVEQRADKCVECGECVEKCPQQINIPEQLKKAHTELTKGGGMPPRKNRPFDE
jgi:uncharacterized protein